MNELSPDLLLPLSKAIMLGAFGYSLMESIRGDESLSEPFERVGIALLALSFSHTFFDGLSTFTKQLMDLLKSHSLGFDVKAFIFESMRAAGSVKDYQGNDTAFNIPEAIEQALRLGVWGVCTQITQFIFMTASFLIEVSQAVLWKLICLFFPVGCGLYPVLPSILKNLVLYSFELSLWMPVLLIIQIVSGDVARTFVQKQGSLGLYIVATELVCIVLTLSVPAVVHKFLAGAFSQDMGVGAVVSLSKRMISNGSSYFRGGIES